MTKKHTVGIIGGAGYTAGELIRILRCHPAVELRFVHSNSQAGKPVSSIHQDLAGDFFMDFTSEVDPKVDVVFLCSGHGKSRGWLAENEVPAETLVVDLSADFRLTDDFVYGLPEMNRAAIKASKRIANPGCFATAIQLGLLPLAAAGKLQDEVHIHAITGSTGAGQQPQQTTHFSWRNNNLSVYKPFQHQHLAEIGRSLSLLQGEVVSDLAFLPLRGDFARGIFATLYLDTELSEKELQALFSDYYGEHVFTHVVAENPHLKQVVNTNKCLVQVTKHGDRALIISVIDNLLKGASGQAVQNMNLALGLEETTGLQLKAMVF
ncbi:MAG: N-acetyl-gamma-glutamyl-phosphate reductase [Lewinella sp.]|jgi:N-acetyl-gamma-glutamyl-phosphate reductase|uniref:N-acetyl-gamma-glutamyl-phosphate reductase n=1 Tax=Lewinella sp. TaxID=2004506 RepID=UPI003D6B5A16